MDKNWIFKQIQNEDLNRLIHGNVITEEKKSFDKSKLCKTRGKCLWKTPKNGEMICSAPEENWCEYKEIRKIEEVENETKR